MKREGRRLNVVLLADTYCLPPRQEESIGNKNTPCSDFPGSPVLGLPGNSLTYFFLINLMGAKCPEYDGLNYFILN